MINSIFTYIINNEEFKTNILKQFGIENCVIGNDINGNKKCWGFVGMGCGITYLKIDKRSKKSIQLKDSIFIIRQKVNDYIYNNWFTNEQKNYYENIGCPIQAVLQQDQQCQIEFYHLIVKYAKEILKIKNITYISNLD